MLRILLPCFALLGFAFLQAQDKWEFVLKKTRPETIRATLKANGMPNLEGGWHWIGPFDNTEGAGFEKAFPPEKAIDLKQSYPGKGGKVEWKDAKDFELGKVFNLKKYITKNPDDTLIYLYTEIDLKGNEPQLMPLKLGSDDTISVWLNGKQLIHENHVRPAAPDQDEVELALKPGKNELLIKVCNRGGQFEVYVNPELPKSFPGHIKNQVVRNFGEAAAPGANKGSKVNTSAEAAHYRIVTLEQPQDCVLEVGGLAFRPDGKLLACTRRGEIWLIDNPNSEDPKAVKWSRFATGLHESLGMYVEDNKTVYAVQRPELTKIVDRDGDGVADEFTTICDKWGSALDYHEFVFGPARDKDGNFFITLNVGFGGGSQAKAPYRGFCVKVSPKGEMEPWAYGLRSPNGVNFSPEGDLFYCDNQGEWVASNKMHHIQKGDFYGHQASLLWVKESPFGKTAKDKVQSGMYYDGQKGEGANAPSGFPELTPPCIWFPYGRMGQSATEPRWDTTAGKFGPFAGQCFVGDQTKSCVMRVFLEKVNGKYQGACFPFRSGFQCGVNRIVFGPDGSLYAGQTNRGWGSLGGKPYGLQRLVYTGTLPFEIHEVHLTKDGFELTFTKPIDEAAAKKLESYGVSSYTYEYHSAYGCPQKDEKAEKVAGVEVATDRKSVRLTVPNLKKGRVYEIRVDGLKDEKGEAVLHPEAFYTLNELK